MTHVSLAGQWAPGAEGAASGSLAGAGTMELNFAGLFGGFIAVLWL